MNKKVLIVGGVAGGASCAARARRLNEKADITIFEQGSYVSFANCGLPYHIGNVIPDRENLIVATPEMFKKWFNIKVKTNRKVELINKEKREIKIKNLITNEIYYENYDALVLSPGATPSLPPIEGLNLPGIFTLRNIPDTLSMKKWLKKYSVKQAVILGGGFIGLELAENLMKLGSNVSIVEIASHIMPSLDKEMASLAQEYITKMGIKLKLGHGINKFVSQNNNTGLKTYLTSGEIIDADIVIIATGVSPEKRLAVEAGIATGSNGGIKVNKYMQTSNSNIWAVGDVIEINDFITNDPVHIPLAGPANRQGRIAAEAIMSSKNSSVLKSFRGVQGTSVCGILGMTIASTGLNERRLKELNSKSNSLSYTKIHVHSYDHAEYYPGAKKIVLKLIFSNNDGRIFGAQALGMAGVEKRIDVIAMAIQNKATVFDLAEAELCYAPQYGSAKDIVNIAGMVGCNILDNYFHVIHWDEIGSKDSIIVDVREDFVYAQEHIEGAINIPLENLRKRVNELTQKKDIYLYCQEGKRSYFACRILSQMGFNVKSFSGGYTMYKAYRNII